MQVLKPLICIVLHLCVFFSSICCDDEANIDDVTLSTELKNIHSFFYGESDMDSPRSLIKETNKNDLSFAIAQQRSCKETDERNTQEAVFYKRLIAILLSNLAIQKIDDKLIGTLSIEASSAQFEYLQNFVNNQGSIREVDRILVSVISQPQYSACYYMAEASYYFNLLSEYLMYYLFLLKTYWDITIISFIVIGSFMILRRQRWSRGLIIFLIIDVIFVISFFITWWRLIQEAEIKLMAAQAQFTEMPIACQPHKMNFWDKIVASFSSTNDCEKYYETIMTNPRLQVTPAFALTHFLSTIIFHPLSYFGTVMSEFIDNATSKVSFLYKSPIVIMLFSSFCLVIIIVPFFLFGGSINFGGPFFGFRINGRTRIHEQQERIERICEDTSLKKLESSEKKQTTSVQEENDPAGGDAGGNTYHLSKKHKKCKPKKCRDKDKNEDEDENMESSGHNKKEEIAESSRKNKKEEENMERNRNNKKEETDDDG